MILYERDWLKYPGAIPDFNTRNESFLDIVATLRKMGVKNCLWPLALHDQRLVGVNPFDLTISDDLKLRIAIEVENNPWYYIREILKLPEAGTDGVNITANRAFLAQWWARMQSIDVFNMQPRQTGKSVTADSEHVWKTIFYGYRSNRFLLTKDRALVVKNTQRLKKIRSMLPPYLWYPSKKDKDVEDVFNYAARENELILRPAQNDPISAINAARGFTNDDLHVDEVPFVKYIDVMLPAIASSMDAAIANAMKNKTLYGKLFTTTAGDLSLTQGRYAYELYASGCPFTEQFYDSNNREELVEFITRNTGNPNPMFSMTFSHRMLGISDEEMWRRIRSVPSTDEDVNKDYFLIWGKGGVNNVVPVYILDAMGKSAIQPKYTELTETGYVIKWYIDKEDIDGYMKLNPTVMGIDTSEQIKRDSTAMVIINPVNLTVVATISISDGNIITTAKWLASFMSKYSRVTMIIEKKSSAQTFIDTLILSFIAEGINPFKRIWNKIVDDVTMQGRDFELVRRGSGVSTFLVDTNRKYLGFNQTGNTRNLLYSQVLQEASSQSRYVINDVSLVNQISMLKINEEGRIDHVSSGHDDMVMAWLLAHWMIRFGRNLDFYGLDSRRIMFNVSDDGKQMEEDDFIEHEIVESLSAEADEIIAQIRREKHPGMKDRLEHRLKRVNRDLESYGVEPKTVDAIIKHGVDEKKAKARSRRWFG